MTFREFLGLPVTVGEFRGMIRSSYVRYVCNRGGLRLGADDYGNIYSVQPCQSCQSCFEFHKVDTAEIKVKAFDFVPR